MARQDEQLQEILNGMKNLVETSNLNQQQLRMFQAQVGELQSEIKALTEEVKELKAHNELTNAQFRELYKAQSLEELLDKMSSIGKDAVKADECTVYTADDEKGQEALKKTAGVTSFSVENGSYTMTVPLEDQKGEIIGVVVAKRDYDDLLNEQFKQADARVFDLNEGVLGTVFRASLEQKIAENLAVTDKLTHLKNRDGMSNFVKSEVLQRAQQGLPVSAIMFDIDHFKGFNDTYGHDIGDKCLKLVAQTIKDSVRVEDSGVFRFGGEEMIVILPVDEEKAFAVAERIRQAVEATALVVDDKTRETTQVAVSGGVSEFAPKPVELDKNRIEAAFDRCLKDADNFLYDAKEDGRNRIFGSKEIMQNHRSLPSPTELFQYWYDNHNENLTLLTAIDLNKKEQHWSVVDNSTNETSPQYVHSFMRNNDINRVNSSCIDDIFATDTFFYNAAEIAGVVAPANGKTFDDIAGSSHSNRGADANKRFAIAVLDEWEQVKDTLTDNAYKKYSADVEAIRAMVYTPDAINVKDIIDERREQAMDKINAFFQNDVWWKDFKKVYSEVNAIPQMNTKPSKGNERDD